MEDAIVVFTARQYAVQMISVGISNENLTELIAAYEFYNLLHATGIEFVENIVEQQ